MQFVLDVLQVTGLFLGGLALYTLVSLVSFVLLAGLGYRYQQFKQRLLAEPTWSSADS